MNKSPSSSAISGRIHTPLPDKIEVKEFDLATLPDSLEPWIEDIAHRMQCPPDFPAIAAIIGLAAAVGSKAKVYPKQNDQSWSVVPNLWGCLVGEPSVKKTPALDEALAPLKKIENENRLKYKTELTEFKKLTDMRNETGKHLKKNIQIAIKNNETDKAKVLSIKISNLNDGPKRRRLIINDATIEKIGDLLAENSSGLLLEVDELRRFFNTLEKQGHETDRQFYLEYWNGNRDYTIDRIGRGTIDIPNCCISLVSTIQPGPLAAMLRSFMKSGGDDDGLFQRLQLAVQPDTRSALTLIDKPPKHEEQQKATRIFRKLVDFEGPPRHFSNDGQFLFDKWYSSNQKRIENSDTPSVLQSHFSKYPSLVPTLALLIFLADAPDSKINDPIDSNAVDKAIRMTEYLATHAHRIYAPITSPELTGAHRILHEYEQGKLPSELTARIISRKGWTGLKSGEVVEKALCLLEDHNYIGSTLIDTGGRPKRLYTFFPKH